MFLKLNPWKLLTALIAAFVAVVCGSGPSKAASVSIKAPSGSTTEPTVEQRIAKVREEFTDREQHSTESNLTRPEPSDLQAKEEEELISQYWSNWSNYWNNY